MKDLETSGQLLKLLEEGVSSFHTIQASVKRLAQSGFQRLHLRDKWELCRGGKYYVVYHGTTLFAFTVAEEFVAEDGFRMAAAHGDFPGFRIKPSPDMHDGGYMMVNTETYGGANLASWLDRPLSVAGRVILKSENPFSPKECFVDFKKPILTIPNVAIHMNRELNKGVELNKQTHMLPLAGIMEEGSSFMEVLAEKAGVSKEEILDYELNVYNTDPGALVGVKEEFISAPRLDNLTSVHAILTGLTEGKRTHGINMGIVFDHEEIGSRTKQGAGSTLLTMVLEKIYDAFGYTSLEMQSAVEDSLLMSVDVAHGYHPSYKEKYDPTNRCVLNQGICIKEASTQSYATDSEAIAIVMQICEKEGIAFQKAVNRSDIPGGGTLGSIASSMLPVRTVDLGVPLLSMHSAREMMGAKDQEELVRYLRAYFSL